MHVQSAVVAAPVNSTIRPRATHHNEAQLHPRASGGPKAALASSDAAQTGRIALLLLRPLLRTPDNGDLTCCNCRRCQCLCSRGRGLCVEAVSAVRKSASVVQSDVTLRRRRKILKVREKLREKAGLALKAKDKKKVGIFYLDFKCTCLIPWGNIRAQ